MKTDVPWQIILSLALLSGCLSVDVPSHKEETSQGDDIGLIKEPKTGERKKPLPCYEDDHRFSPSIPKDIWKDKKRELILSTPVDYIVVRDGGKRCHTHAECLKALSNELRDRVSSECQALDNFYIGGDGEVYEGRGWDWAPYWHLNGMRKRAVTVKFLGSHDSEGPGERAMRAFWRMVKFGIWQWSLSPDYRVLSMRHLYNDSSLLGHALEKVLFEYDVTLMEVNMMETWWTTPDKTIPLITRDEWSAKKLTMQATDMRFRIKYIIINEGGERCYTHEECMSLIKSEQAKQVPIYGDLIDNFYIGDDGYVYEGRGFNHKPLWDTEINMENMPFKDESITVRIFGNFRSNIPSEEAIGALKLLINVGMSLNRIFVDYKLFSLRNIYNDSRFLGDTLFQIANKWTPWVRDLEEGISKKIAKGEGFIRMVNNSRSDRMKSAKLSWTDYFELFS